MEEQKLKLPLTPIELIEFFCSYHGMTYDELCEGQYRLKANIKKMIVGILRDDYKLTYHAIGHLLKRNHATIINSYECFHALCGTDKHYETAFKLLRKLSLHEVYINEIRDGQKQKGKEVKF